MKHVDGEARIPPLVLANDRSDFVSPPAGDLLIPRSRKKVADADGWPYFVNNVAVTIQEFGVCVIPHYYVAVG
jgi:hypothetical protein